MSRQRGEFKDRPIPFPSLLCSKGKRRRLQNRIYPTPFSFLAPPQGEKKKIMGRRSKKGSLLSKERGKRVQQRLGTKEIPSPIFNLSKWTCHRNAEERKKNLKAYSSSMKSIEEKKRERRKGGEIISFILSLWATHEERGRACEFHVFRKQAICQRKGGHIPNRREFLLLFARRCGSGGKGKRQRTFFLNVLEWKGKGNAYMGKLLFLRRRAWRLRRKPKTSRRSRG